MTSDQIQSREDAEDILELAKEIFERAATARDCPDFLSDALKARRAGTAMVMQIAEEELARAPQDLSSGQDRVKKLVVTVLNMAEQDNLVGRLVSYING